jgi:hypothetical protein
MVYQESCLEILAQKTMRSKRVALVLIAALVVDQTEADDETRELHNVKNKD